MKLQTVTPNKILVKDFFIFSVRLENFTERHIFVDDRLVLLLSIVLVLRWSYTLKIAFFVYDLEI